MPRMGAFKFRGAFTVLYHFDAAQRKASVVALSSDNRAQRIALAARELGIPATIVMPRKVPAAEVATTQGYGATVVLYDRYIEDREQSTRAMAPQYGLKVIPPFDHADVLAGQGTARRRRSCSRQSAHSTRCSCAWTAAGSCRARRWPRGPCRPAASSTA